MCVAQARERAHDFAVSSKFADLHGFVTQIKTCPAGADGTTGVSLKRTLRAKASNAKS
jgi:hypothetical protein